MTCQKLLMCFDAVEPIVYNYSHRAQRLEIRQSVRPLNLVSEDTVSFSRFATYHPQHPLLSLSVLSHVFGAVNIASSLVFQCMVKWAISSSSSSTFVPTPAVPIFPASVQASTRQPETKPHDAKSDTAPRLHVHSSQFHKLVARELLQKHTALCD